MKNSTQLMIGAALLVGVAVLFILPQPKAGKSGEEHAGSKVPEQATAVPKKETQVVPEPEVAPDLMVEPTEIKPLEGEETTEVVPVETEEPEKPINPILALVDKIEDVVGKVRVLSNFAGSLARTGDAQQASVILAQVEELLDTIEADDELAAATGFFASAKLHAGEIDAAMEMLERTLGLIKKIDGSSSKLAMLGQLTDVLGKFPDNERVQKFITTVKERTQALKHQSN
ncbi:uncharacterized protein METZ01_LOCUS436722, partial [marine metagenome]